MKFDINDLRTDFENLTVKMREQSKTVLITAITVLSLTVAACVIVFLMSVRGSEQVMVPHVIGKDLAVAMLEMQVKELYPKIQLRYSDNPNDRGTILEQSPAPGSIVKAGRRINLIVSRGIIVDRVENFVGQNYDEVRMHLQTLFTSMVKPLLSIKEPALYKFNTAPAGTILEQNPPPDTAITGPVELELVISRGPENEKVTVPALIGLSITDTLVKISRSKVIFDFSFRAPEGMERSGTVVSQLPSEQSPVAAYSRASAVLAFPVKSTDGRVYGIFQEDLPLYPYPFQIKLDAVSPTGDRYELVTLKHPGGPLSIPYAVPEGTLLILTILNKEVATVEVRAPATGE